MVRRWVFNPPPGWPVPAKGWTPDPGWQPDPMWPGVPDGWELWRLRRPAHPWLRRLVVTLVVFGAVFGGAMSDLGSLEWWAGGSDDLRPAVVVSAEPAGR